MRVRVRLRVRVRVWVRVWVRKRVRVSGLDAAVGGAHALLYLPISP